MSLPPELRVLCAQLSSTPVNDLPRRTPMFLRHISRSHVPLSSPTANAAKADASASSVLVHKLKTQLSSLLNGKSAEGRFTAVVLIKAVVEVGGWEILKGSEPWVRGLLSILGKQDSSSTKEMCIVTLTKIYCMTHQYQTLLREITTPTLPSFITTCLNLISSKAADTSSSFVETIFQSFIVLLPRHTTMYRPFATRIRVAAKQYLAPTTSDDVLVPSSLQESAQRLVIMLHQTVAKGGGGEEWGKSFRELLKSAHVTADNVFRAVIEDWESTAGYVSVTVDINQAPSGGGRTAEDLPSWTGMNAGAERLTGLLEFLASYFHVETSTPVTIPLGSVVDLIVRVLSVAIPASHTGGAKGGPRLNPAIDREEKDALWSGLPQIYVATLHLIEAIADRMEDTFGSLSQGLLMQITWIFTYGKHASAFRQSAYSVVARLLLHAGQSLNKSQTAKLTVIIRSCCNDLQRSQKGAVVDGTSGIERNSTNGSAQIADNFLRQASDTVEPVIEIDPILLANAEKLLSLFISSLPQHHLDISLRSLVERTAILNHNKSAMLACVLTPFVGKNGHPLASIVPHLTRAFGNDATTEILLRPRMPLVPASTTRLVNDSYIDVSEDEDMDFDTNAKPTQEEKISQRESVKAPVVVAASAFGPSPNVSEPVVAAHSVGPSQDPPNVSSTLTDQKAPVPTSAFLSNPPPQPPQAVLHDTPMGEASDDESDAESVHLTMQLDSDSDSDVE